MKRMTTHVPAIPCQAREPGKFSFYLIDHPVPIRL